MRNMILEEIRKLKRSKTQPNPRRPIQPPKTYIPQEKLVEKSNSSKPISVKTNTSRADQVSLNLFEGYIFCFPIVDIDLSPKRVECMTKSIIFQGGKVVPFKEQGSCQFVDFLLVNPKAPIHLVLKKVHKKIDFRQILDYNFVLRCMREEVLLAISNFTIYRNRQYDQQIEENQDEEDERTITVSVSPKPTKMIKCQRKGVRIMEEVKDIDFQRPKKLEIQTDAQEEEQTITMVGKRKAPQFVIVEKEEEKDEPLLGSKRQINREAFLCQRPANSNQNTFSMNKFICEQLMKLQKIYESERDIGRKIAYLKAVSAIKTLDKEIQSEHDVESLKGVGPKIIKKVKELLETGKMQKLQRLQKDDKRVICQNFCKIWGVGPSKAEELYHKGFKSIEQLRKNPELLNKNQTIGLRYFEDLQIKMPREKVSRIFDRVRQTFSRLVESVGMYHLQVCGSYRRGRSHCGDIDILISRKDGLFQKKLLLNLVLQLEQIGLLTDHLVFPSASKEHKSMSYMGICQLDEKTHHRIDIKYYPIDEYPYALLYFTGSDMFNRSMRLYASKLGIQLSDHGATARRRNPTDDFWDKPIPVCEKEKDIFDFLGMDYKQPWERDV